MKSRRIVIGGKIYNGVDEMPEDVRQKYEEIMRKFDQNQNGIPDMLEGGNLFADNNQNGMPDAFEELAALAVQSKILASTNIQVNGQTYESLDQLPPEIRAKYEQAMSRLDANHNGVPDFMEVTVNENSSSGSGMADVITPQANPNPFPVSTFPAASSNPLPASPVIEPVSTGNWGAIIAGIVLIGFCLLITAAGVWYYFLR